MLSSSAHGPHGATAVGVVAALVGLPLALLLVLGGGPSATAAPTAVTLGSASAFGVLGAETVTNTGPSVISRDLGTSPGSAVTGFPPGTVLGTIHTADAAAGQAQSDLAAAYGVVAGQASDELISSDLAGRTLTTGVYTASSGMGLSGQLTLDAQGDRSALFIFQVGSTLTIASGSAITLTNGAQACNVFWQVGSSATLGTGSSFRGTILAMASISATTGATVEGRLLARTGAVTLDNNRITAPGCETGTVGSTGSASPGGTGTTGSTGGTGSTATTGGTENAGGNGGTGTANNDGSSASSSGAPSSNAVLTDVHRRQEADLPGNTPTEHQIARVPRGFPATGDGSPLSDLRPAAIWIGIVALLLAGGAALSWHRLLPRD